MQIPDSEFYLVEARDGSGEIASKGVCTKANIQRAIRLFQAEGWEVTVTAVADPALTKNVPAKQPKPAAEKAAPVLLAKPPKNIGEMTREELVAWARELHGKAVQKFTEDN